MLCPPIRVEEKPRNAGPTRSWKGHESGFTLQLPEEIDPSDPLISAQGPSWLPTPGLQDNQMCGHLSEWPQGPGTSHLSRWLVPSE